MKKFLIATTFALFSLSVFAGGVGSEGTGSFIQVIFDLLFRR